MFRLKLPFGTLMPKWMSKNNLKEALNAVTLELGIDIKHGAAFLDPMQVIIKRVIELVKKGMFKLYPDMILKVQVLWDAATIWRSMKVNGTTIVLKFIYNDKNSDGKRWLAMGLAPCKIKGPLGSILVTTLKLS